MIYISEEQLRNLIREEVSLALQHPPINVTIVLSQEEAQTIAEKIPDSIIVSKVIKNIKSRGLDVNLNYR